MKGIIFCSIFLLWTITVLNSKSYLVEVDDNDQGNSNQDTAETPADQEEGIDEAADEVGVEDINDDINDETEGILVLFLSFIKTCAIIVFYSLLT